MSHGAWAPPEMGTVRGGFAPEPPWRDAALPTPAPRPARAGFLTDVQQRRIRDGRVFSQASVAWRLVTAAVGCHPNTPLPPGNPFPDKRRPLKGLRKQQKSFSGDTAKRER